MDADLQKRIDALENALFEVSSQLAHVREQRDIDRRDFLYRLSVIGPENLRSDLPANLRFYKNLCRNSSFEQPGTAGAKPTDWTGGVLSPDASWYGTHSLKLTTGQTSQQEPAALVTATWYNSKATWVVYRHKFGAVRCEVLTDTGTVIYTKNETYVSDWPDGQVAFLFQPGTAAKFGIRFTNIDPSQDVYIDAVQIEPDFNGKFPSIYADGPFSAEGGTSGGGPSFGQVKVATQTVAASVANDQFELQAGANVTIAADPATKRVTISATGGGAGAMTALGPVVLLDRVIIPA